MKIEIEENTVQSVVFCFAFIVIAICLLGGCYIANDARHNQANISGQRAQPDQK